MSAPQAIDRFDPQHTTLVSLLAEKTASEPDRPALQFKQGEQWTSWTWGQLAACVASMARTLRQQYGVQPQDRVAQVAENSPQWIVLDLAVLSLGAIHVPMHATLAGYQFQQQIDDCRPRLVVLSGEHQWEKLRATEVPRRYPLASHSPCPEPVKSLASQEPTVSPEEALEFLQQAAGEVEPQDLATILYTSGTTGEPKGVMLSHGNLASNALATVQVFEHHPGDVRLCWLPLSHIFARTCDLYTWVVSPGVELALAQSRDTLVADMAEVRPTLMNGVPYFFEKVMREVKDHPEVLPQVFGGRLRACCSGGAALPEHVARFYLQHGICLIQGYGLTETSPVATVCLDPQRAPSAGKPVPGTEIKIAEDGEILIRGPLVMKGYWNRPQATAEAIRDGWFHTGDVGHLDPEGYLFITGRKKEIIVTSAGKNVAPALIEGLLTQDPLIEQAIVIGDDRPFLVALIVVEPKRLQQELQARGIDAPWPECLQDPRVQELYRRRIDGHLSGLSPHEQVGQFALLHEPFTIQREELTPTLKLRRKVIQEHYAEVIEELYRRRRTTPA